MGLQPDLKEIFKKCGQIMIVASFSAIGANAMRAPENEKDRIFSDTEKLCEKTLLGFQLGVMANKSNMC